ncbi:GGDEF domain-containing protein [Aestuariispira insulae]|uniref:Diguanylate cyclase (GGDEF)-like protein n=1 Tax=Aestuariispira insulae TaxID=1461337 RepID=A0A3D9HRS6_9PROT|nr:GGDEF domain-containing protein [Aestuariispira insulae]RED52214.1 diguanylate cyclase (GGDEF)-like protein [Aestuariispira insulae]
MQPENAAEPVRKTDRTPFIDKMAGARFAERLQILFSAQVTSTISTLVVMAVIVFLQYDNTEEGFIWPWLFYMVIISLLRVVLVSLFDKQQADLSYLRKWHHLYVLGTFLQGAGWGAAAFGFLPLDLPSHQLITIFLLGGVCAAAMTSMAADPASYFSFICPILLPLSFRFAILGDVEQITLAMIVACYFLFLLIAFRRSHAQLMASLQLRHENADLLQEVMAEKEEIKALNQELQHEIQIRRAAERRAQSLAMTDQLTGLANRQHFEIRLNEAIELSKRTGQAFGLLVIDLDRFGQVNDLFDHTTGDKVLREIASRMREKCRTIDTVARTGGDEFAVIVTTLDRQGLEHTPADRILDALQKPITIDEHQITISLSIGAAFYPAQKNNSTALMVAAETALADAKSRGGGTCAAFEEKNTRQE